MSSSSPIELWGTPGGADAPTTPEEAVEHFINADYYQVMVTKQLGLARTSDLKVVRTSNRAMFAAQDTHGNPQAMMTVTELAPETYAVTELKVCAR